MQRAGWYNTHMIPPVIISASRRTDVPAFHADWFSACLSSGIATFRNPYSGRPAAVSLERSRVAAFVFWTRDPRPFFPVLARLEREGFPSVFHVTVTGLSREIEPFVPPLAQAVSAFRRLSETIGPRRGLWEPSEGLRASVERIVALGRARGFTMLSCCTPLLAGWGVPPGACVDGDSLRSLYPAADIPASHSPVRPGCLCRSSRGLGP